MNDTTYQVDSSTYVLQDLNELAFLFGAEEATDTTIRPQYLLDLQDGLFLTPDGDSDHDVLHVLLNIPVAAFQFTVLDRMDNILFQTTDPDQAWNGRYMNSGDLQDNGVYRYLIELDDLQDSGEFILKH
ncbi:MAG: gliding motility-associated C-terminal domain-containing protein [Bacteroidetes bacterium]|nr:gliding motility-associated C-terminal domain-containing protein [Bacteroidota bacterium]